MRERTNDSAVTAHDAVDLITREDLSALIRRHDGWCVSLFAPMVRAGSEVRQNRLRWKNLLADATQRLEERGAGKGAEEVLAPAARLLEDADFWQRQSEGLACFLATDGDWIFRLSREFAEAAHVIDGCFVLRPLLPLLSYDGKFYVLALSQNQVRLFQATRQTIHEVDVEGMPKSLEEARWLDDPEKSLQHHSSGPKAPNARPAAIFHGHGLPSDFEEKQVRRYLEQLDRHLQSHLEDDRAPLVVAGVDQLRAMWAEVSGNSSLVEEGIGGNPETWGAEELHERAWPIVGPMFRRRIERDLAGFRQLESGPRTAGDVERILAAAEEGRVEVLFVDRDEGDFPVLDRAVGETLRRDGRVHALAEEDMPVPTAAAAIFRY